MRLDTEKMFMQVESPLFNTLVMREVATKVRDMFVCYNCRFTVDPIVTFLEVPSGLP